MISAAIENSINSQQVVLYRRVSTKSQAKGEYRSQLNSIKSLYPNFKIGSSTLDDIKEVISGRSDPEVRMAAGLGKALRKLKHNRNAIVLVSTADRISRRADVFELIRRQGLGGRVFDAETGQSLDDLVSTGLHHRIEAQTEADRVSRQLGLRRRKASGGTLGAVEIQDQARKGMVAKMHLAKERSEKVFCTVEDLVRQGRGQKPSHDDICDELNRREVRTGQGRFFTPDRLSQFCKSRKREMFRAQDSYARPRRRLRRRLIFTLVEYRKRRLCLVRMRRLTATDNLFVNLATANAFRLGSTYPPLPVVTDISVRSRQGRCRGPPPKAELLTCHAWCIP